jgi:hypothetical protein
MLKKPDLRPVIVHVVETEERYTFEGTAQRLRVLTQGQSIVAARTHSEIAVMDCYAIHLVYNYSKVRLTNIKQMSDEIRLAYNAFNSLSRVHFYTSIRTNQMHKSSSQSRHT